MLQVVESVETEKKLKKSSPNLTALSPDKNVAASHEIDSHGHVCFALSPKSVKLVRLLGVLRHNADAFDLYARKSELIFGVWRQSLFVQLEE